MEIFTAIESRRSVKHFDPNHRLTAEERKKLLDLARLSPTAFNIQHWRFVVAEDQELRKQIRAAAWNQAQVTDASLLLVLCADLKAWEKDPKRYWSGAPQPVQDFLVPAIGQYYESRPEAQRDEAIRSCGIAAQTVMLAARGMGLDSCPMDGFDFEQVGKLINLPADHCIVMMIAVGRSVQDPWPRQGQISDEEAVILNRF